MDPRENTPWLYRSPSTVHYYGDTVRQLLLGAAAVMLAGAPFYADNIAVEGPILVIAAVTLAVVAGVMSPQMRFAKIASVLVSVMGAIFFELWALAEYQNTHAFSTLFLIRQILALVFFFALYFSLKTTRADLIEGIYTDTAGDDEDMTELVAKADEEFAAQSDDSQIGGHGDPTT